MAYTLEQLSADIRGALKADAGDAGKQAVCAWCRRSCSTRNSSLST